MAAAVPAYHSSTPSFRRHYRDRLRAVPLALVLVVGVLAAPQATTTCALLRVELPPKLASWPCLTSRRPRDEALALPLRLRGAGPSQEDGEEDLHESVGQADGDEKDPTAFNVAEEEMMSKIDRLNLRARGDADKLEPEDYSSSDGENVVLSPAGKPGDVAGGAESKAEDDALLPTKQPTKQAEETGTRPTPTAEKKVLRPSKREVDSDADSDDDEEEEAAEQGAGEKGEEEEDDEPKPFWVEGEDIEAMYQGEEFQRYRKQVASVVDEFAIGDGSDLRLEPGQQAAFDEVQAHYDEVTTEVERLNATAAEYLSMLGGVRGAQRAPPGEEDAPSDVLRVASGGGGGRAFETLSEAVNVSCSGEQIIVEAGDHTVGAALGWMGVQYDDDATDACEGDAVFWPRTIHIHDDWDVRISSDPEFFTANADALSAGEWALPTANVDGRWAIGNKTRGGVRGLGMRFRAVAQDSGFAREPHGYDVTLQQDLPEDAFEIGGVVLVVARGGIWTWEGCKLAVNGGDCVSATGECDLTFRTSALGGFARDERKLEFEAGQGPPGEDVAARYLNLLASDSNPRCGNAVMSSNQSKVTMQGCRLAHIYNAAARVCDAGRISVEGSRISDAAIGVGVQQEATAEVSGCLFEIVADPVLPGAAFFCGEGGGGTLRLRDNVVNGPRWLGSARPGKLDERGTTGEEPYEDDSRSELPESALTEEQMIQEIQAAHEEEEAQEQELAALARETRDKARVMLRQLRAARAEGFGVDVDDEMMLSPERR